MNTQAPSSVVMVRPHKFTPNPETEVDNKYQRNSTAESADIAKAAYQEVTNVANTLSEHGIDVHLFEDKTDSTPDSVFPNNWFTTHHSGEVYLYPMFAKNRRLERRHDIVDFLQEQYHVRDVIDWTQHEIAERYLEGTGAIVFDHINKIAFAVRSNRCDEDLFKELCQQLGYQALCFSAVDDEGTPVYHTNVIMCVGTGYVLLADEMIPEIKERQKVLDAISNSGNRLISLSSSQISQFCGNALEIMPFDPSHGHADTHNARPILAMSQSAFEGLKTQQIDTIKSFANVLAIDVKTIELAGGSLRCMLAGIHLKPKR
jgi:hypothetical protein